MGPIELNQVTVETPCPKRWEELAGDERERFCGHCSLHVHNLSALVREEARSLLERRASGGERLCVTFLRRADGSMVTADGQETPGRGGFGALLDRVAPRSPALQRLLGFLGLLPLLTACRPGAGPTATMGSPVVPPAPSGETPGGETPGLDSSGSGAATGTEPGCVEILGEAVLPEPVQLPPAEPRILGRVANPMRLLGSVAPPEPVPEDSGADPQAASRE